MRSIQSNFSSMKLILAGTLLISATAFAQAPAGSNSARPQIPRLTDGKPDFSGVWDHPFVQDMTKDGPNQKGLANLPFTPWGLDEWKKYDPDKFDYTAHCLPLGLTRSVNSPFPLQFISTPGQVVMLVEMNNTFHVIPTDGRRHPTDLERQWNGLSVGHWEGDTLVVVTEHFNDKTRLDTIGHPHSEDLKVTQRFTRTDPTHIAYEMIIEDPKTYTQPWKNTRTFTLRPDWEIMEYSCEENNKDVAEGHMK